MAQSNTFTTAGSTLVKNYRKIGGKVYKAFKSKTEEYGWFDAMPEEDITFSAREMLFPVDINAAYGTAMIPEAGYEARTVTPAMDEGTVTWVNMNQRFTISLTAKYLDAAARDGQIVRQVEYQTMKAVEAMARRVGQQTYGFSTGVVAKCSAGQASASSHTITLIDAFGHASLDNATYLSSLFKVGEGVALIQGGALVTNAIGEVTAVGSGTITVSWGGAVTITANDEIVFANAVTDATITATDYNRWPVGFLDATTSTSVHGISGSSVPNWTAGYTDTAGGRFSFVKLKKARQGIHNKGAGVITDVIWSNGVENDVEAGERAALRYDSAMALSLDGSVKAKGVSFHTSALVPNGCVFAYDRSGYSRFALLDKPAENGEPVPFTDMDKAEDRNALKASIDFPYARMVRSRAKLAVFTGLTEQ